LESYCDYVIENWTAFEKGQYEAVTARPEINYKFLLNEEIVRDNLPELTLEERVLVNMDTMDIPKNQSA
jgi:hypothetical protein